MECVYDVSLCTFSPSKFLGTYMDFLMVYQQLVILIEQSSGWCIDRSTIVVFESSFIKNWLLTIMKFKLLS